ncbi:alpha-2,8-polysialyltransferase family protein [Streptomyces sp. ODS05-4]|uniref:alpha-2,8-polysialyltransferase family protein n=1 Tax=Streptomyces sp. ODS05-4 TaxID=2944939 RepID=UPI00210EE76C|nr:alpha-2,8-polysialyltransferase family protein [Streptomyces sp. ODS05-4]
MSTRVLCASTLYGAVTLAAALDSGCFAAADRTVLVVCTTAAIPETAVPLDRMPGFERLRDRFDRVVSWNEAIAPFHPSGWSPRADDAPLWERYLRMLWELGDDPVELALESLQVPPALSLARLFPDAPIDVYADGLMSYGPTRNKLDPLVGERVRRLLHLDLVPGLRPLLLAEFSTVPEVIPTAAFTTVVASLEEGRPESAAEAAEPGGGALLLGQYLSALAILTPDEEEELHLSMVRGAVAEGHTRLLFKPHPVAPASWTHALEQEAAALGAELTVIDRPELAEVLLLRLRPALVVACFSTGLFTAAHFYGVPVARVGTGLLLERLTPYENSNRVPVTLADALLPDLAAGGRCGPPYAAGDPLGPAGGNLPGLVAAVGYAMQPKIRPDLRTAAERFLGAHLDETVRRYFKRRRLTALGLPGGLPAPRRAVVRRLARRPAVRRVALRVRRAAGR